MSYLERQAGVLQEKINEVFEYVPGRSVDEELPMKEYKEEELSPR